MTKKRQSAPPPKADAFRRVGFLYLSVDEVVRVVGANVFHNLLAGTEVLLTSYWELLPQTKTSNRISKLLRPVLEHRRIRTIFGANLAGALILIGSTATPAAVEMGPSEVDVMVTETAVVTTKQRFGLPVTNLTGISQGFSFLHPGVDMRAPLGTAVAPVASGQVLAVVKDRVGYGNHVVVEHEGGLSSLYAHLDEISVHVGQKVAGDTQLGTVGLTGWTSGPHLHLEVYEKGKAFNPMSVINLPETTKFQAL